jgi:hypothetical protein
VDKHNGKHEELWIAISAKLIYIERRKLGFFSTMQMAQQFQAIVRNAGQKEGKDLSKEESNEGD